MLKPFNVSQTFGVTAHAGLEVMGYVDDSHPQIPTCQQGYVFRNALLRDVLAYLHNSGGDGLFLTGPTGSGKTSLITQIAARLNWPVQSVTCHGRLELQALIGQFVLINGSTQYVHGPLSVAVREGHLLILNESDLMDPSELAGLNDIIEGHPLIIAENGGEVIYPHPQFRLFATGNSGGAGDTTGLYQGVLRQNLAFMDRFRVVQVDYPDTMIEQSILQAAIPSLPAEIVSMMLRVANEIRRLFVGTDTNAGELTVTMSTRTLVRWGTLTVIFKGAPNVFEYALTQALTARAEPEQREAIHRIAADVFGDYWQVIPQNIL